MSIKVVIAVAAIALAGYACSRVSAQVEAIEYDVSQAVQPRAAATDPTSPGAT